MLGCWVNQGGKVNYFYFLLHYQSNQTVHFKKNKNKKKRIRVSEWVTWELGKYRRNGRVHKLWQSSPPPEGSIAELGRNSIALICRPSVCIFTTMRDTPIYIYIYIYTVWKRERNLSSGSRESEKMAVAAASADCCEEEKEVPGFLHSKRLNVRGFAPKLFGLWSSILMPNGAHTSDGC